MATEQVAKRLKTNEALGPLIGTHNGTFHADEALAVYLLRLLPPYNPSQLVRTRDPAKLSECHTVVDVGGEYSAAANRYDHHQRTFETTFPGRPTKLSSAGLVYLHFGKAIIARRTKLAEDSPEVEVIWHKVYTEFIEALDAHDNGISVYDPSETKDLTKRFADSGINLGSLVSDLNNEYDDDDDDKKPTASIAPQAGEDEQFLKASSLMGTVFMRKLNYYTKAWYPARTFVRETFTARTQYDSQGRIMLFDKGCPWKDHLYTIEEEEEVSEANKVVYVLYPESQAPESKWRVQAVGIKKDSFESRKGLPAAWRGIRDEELSQISGVPGCIFVHASGFIGGNLTKEGALEMAKRALDM